MQEEAVYAELAKHLDEALIGVPPSPPLMKILKILYSPEEAEIGMRLPFGNTRLADLEEMFPEKADSLGEILDHMARRGTVYKSTKQDQEPEYRLLPSVVGFVETPFWPGKDTDEVRELAPLWIQYLHEGFGYELARGTPVVRVVPVDESLQDESQVLPYDALKERIGETSYIAVAHCPCRQMLRYEGAGCDHSLENCFHFGSMGRYIVSQGMGRELKKYEALKLLREAADEGLVHICDNLEDHMGTICNCCSCCCVFMRSMRMGLDTFCRSNYAARVDTDTCIGCATCEDRCPVKAVAVGDEDVAEVKEETCIGCGVCTPTCDTEAISLVRRGEVKPPPDLVEFVTLRAKP